MQPVSRTLIDVDDELLSQAGRVLGTRTKKDTVNRALRRVVAVDAGLEELRLFGDGRLGDATIL